MPDILLQGWVGWGLNNKIIELLAAAGFASDPDRLQVECDLFAEHIDYVEDVCKLISHVAVREADRVRAKHSQVRVKTREIIEYEFK